jgi:tRNA A37 threonylcarbamoyladenosine dehydratase
MEIRFDRLRPLLGEEGLARLSRAHVLIVGVGGVGSWTAESLARSGIGRLTLVDPDTVCPTNFNRQIQAVTGAEGRPKADVLAERLLQINPTLRIEARVVAYNRRTSDSILSVQPDAVVDAIDALAPKCHLLAACRAAGLPVVCSTGSAGRCDPAQVRMTDLAYTDVDPLARMVRKVLRRRFGFPREGEGAFGIPAVFSAEEPGGESSPRGTVSFVTGVFGLFCAAAVVHRLIEPDNASA